MLNDECSMLNCGGTEQGRVQSLGLLALQFTIQHSAFKIPRFEGERGQVILRHTELTAYRCFLPDLAGFTGFCCTGPSPFFKFKVLSYEL